MFGHIGIEYYLMFCNRKPYGSPAFLCPKTITKRLDRDDICVVIEYGYF